MERLETKASLAIDDAGVISGIAWPFGSPDRVGDVVEKGAFASARAPVPMLFAHDPADPVGAWTGLVEDSEGFKVTGRLFVDDVARAREVRAFVQGGAVGGLSIGFVTRKASPRRGGGRTISALDLVEVSLVTIPMHPGARLTAAKSAAAAIALAEALNRAAVALRRS
jgi:HK97 family phage prohead protease